jgi:DNA-binding NtrC family response regulator
MTTGPGIFSLRLLIVDDEEGFVNVLTKRLVKRGIHVTVALSGTEGLRALHHNEFDAVVLDLKMKDMDGIELLKRIKKNYPAMAVIMLTGHGSERAAQEGMAFGAFDYLTKPCDLEKLIAKITAAAMEKDVSDG